ncbi:MAG TPA: UDP-N-acetylmuramoyl-L-alanine--D-glutamate ligase, partial [Bacteroidetes bacterium]|nr:UDP-N-acetylmuramoyl-L-alanine--D-glutamate ligase [Bacteroidota bacterium]
HGDIQSYARAKARIWENQDEHDWAVIPLGDRLVAEITLSIKPQKVYVSLEECPRGGAGLEGGKLLLDLSGKREVLLPAAELPLPGRHNIANAISAAAACGVLQLSGREIAAGLRTFPGVEHRLELVGRNGRTWINDSKSTNVDSLRVALEAIPGPVWLIAGGRDKGAPYAPLEPLVRDRVERLLLIGEAARRIEEELGSAAAVCVCGTLEKAVQYAAQFAPPGVSVLLSPACASFDQFENYEQRGETYRRLVEENAGI